MAALTSYRNTAKKDDGVIPQILSFPVEANVNIHQGSLVVINTATGNVKPAVSATGLIAIGRSETLESNVAGVGANNTGGAAGALTVQVRQGCFKWDNGSSSISAANVGATCYLVDDHTVQLTSSTNTLSPAGTIIQVDSDGVWVLTYLGNGSQTTALANP